MSVDVEGATAFPFHKAHFIGLAGVGMSATAILLRDSGVAVTAPTRRSIRRFRTCWRVKIRLPGALCGAEYS